MNLFKPSTDLEISDAVVQAAQRWSAQQLAEATLTPEEADQLSRHREAVSSIIDRPQTPRPQPLSVFQTLAGLTSPDSQSLNDPFLQPIPEELWTLAEETESIKALQEREKARKELLDET